jgi:hypothetical protein
MAGSCEHGNEPTSSIKGKGFLTSYEIMSFSRRTLSTPNKLEVSGENTTFTKCNSYVRPE